MIPSKLHPMVPVQWYFGAIGLYFTFDHTLFRGRGMVSAMLLSISIVALSQFALYYWRAGPSGAVSPPAFCPAGVGSPRGERRPAPPAFCTVARAPSPHPLP